MNGKLAALLTLGSIVGSVAKLYTTKANYYKSRAKTYNELAKEVGNLLKLLRDADE